MNQLGAFVGLLVGIVGGLTGGHSNQQAHTSLSPDVKVSRSIASGTVLFVDITNRAVSPIDAVRFEVSIASPASRRPQTLGFTHDFSLAANQGLGVDVGPLPYAVPRRFVIEVGTEPPPDAAIAATVTTAVYRDGQVFGDPGAAAQFVRRRAAQARELAALIAIVEQARRLPPAAARSHIISGLGARKRILRDADLREVVEESLHDMLRQAAGSSDAGIGVALLNLQDTLQVMKDNAEVFVKLPVRF